MLELKTTRDLPLNGAKGLLPLQFPVDPTPMRGGARRIQLREVERFDSTQWDSRNHKRGTFSLVPMDTFE